MNLRKFYESNGVDYDAFLGRLMGKESLAEKYIKIFLDDPTYLGLSDAVANLNYDQVRRTAHTLKGIALNLSLYTMSDLCMDMMNCVREGNTHEIQPIFQQIRVEYERIIKEVQS